LSQSLWVLKIPHTLYGEYLDSTSVKDVGQGKIRVAKVCLEQWAADWGMVFNPSKCYIMSITNGKTLIPHFTSCVE